MNNSAHDDISTFTDLDELTIHDPDARKVFELIKQMELSEELGCAKTTKQILTLSIEDQDYEAVFECEASTGKSWWEGELSSVIDNHQPWLTHHDIQTIKNGEFEIDLEADKEPLKLSLDELLILMDSHGIARPSNTAKVISDLQRSGELIDVNMDTDTVSMTDLGRVVKKILDDKAPHLTSKNWCSNLMHLLADVEAGDLTPDIPILMAFEDIYGLDEREKIQHISWADPDELYMKRNEETKTSGFIQKLRGQKG